MQIISERLDAKSRQTFQKLQGRNDIDLNLDQDIGKYPGNIQGHNRSIQIHISRKV